MATKKAGSTKKAPARKPSSTKTTVRTVRADAKTTKKPAVKAEAAPATTATASARSRKVTLPKNLVNVVLAELVGTLILTLVALNTFQENGSLFVGLTLTVLVMTIGIVSGSHVNPAVTFGLWASRKLKTVLVPFYWVAQLLGAMLAIIITNWVSGDALSVNFGHIANLNWSVFGAELVGAAVFLFGLTAAVSRKDLTASSRAFAIGLSLMAGLLVGGSLLGAVKSQAIANYQRAAAQQSASSSAPEIPYAAFVKGVTVNPAIALATTDRTSSELTSGSQGSDETVYSRFTLEVILGTLVGAALGGNLYLLLVDRRKDQ